MADEGKAQKGGRGGEFRRKGSTWQARQPHFPDGVIPNHRRTLLTSHHIPPHPFSPLTPPGSPCSFAAARASGVQVAFESAVAGGIPIIKALREGLAANRIDWVAGIVNGTSNFVLSKMRDTGASFAEALAQAQALGYAEADPTLDVGGGDAAHKLALLAAVAFGVPPLIDAVYTEGIQHLEVKDIKYAEEFGFRLKLLAIAVSRFRGGVGGAWKESA